MAELNTKLAHLERQMVRLRDLCQRKVSRFVSTAHQNPFYIDFFCRSSWRPKSKPRNLLWVDINHAKESAGKFFFFFFYLYSNILFHILKRHAGMALLRGVSTSELSL
jgi:hypothetical protein